MFGYLDQRFGEANGEGARFSIPRAMVMTQNSFEALSLDKVRE